MAPHPSAPHHDIAAAAARHHRAGVASTGAGAGRITATTAAITPRLTCRRRGPSRRPAPQPFPAPQPPSDQLVYSGPFTARQAERLLWRAGFGPRPGQAQQLAPLGLAGAVQSLTRASGAPTLSGAAPVDENGQPLAPADSWGHDHLYWLDRMVRSGQSLVERMALVWHDWFATSNAGVNSQQHMLDQVDMFRVQGLGSFHDLLRAVTVDPAMLTWLNGTDNRAGETNENYGREVMELFTLGADRGAAHHLTVTAPPVAARQPPVGVKATVSEIFSR